MLAARIEQIERLCRRHENQVGVFERALDAPVQVHERLIEAAHMAIEFGVLLFRDVFLRAGPQCGRRVDGFLLAIGAFEHDGQGNMVRIGFDDVAQARLFEELVFALAQFHADRGAAAIAFALADGEFTGTVGYPAPGLVLAGAPADNLHLARHHERRIETDAEVAD